LKKINKIEETKDFLPQKNKYCYYCDFLEICKKQQKIT